MTDKGLWAWAVDVYGREGVADACLTLQDDDGQCVPYLLWAAWAGACGLPLEATTCDEAARLAQTWQAEIISGLRVVRRRLKSPIRDMDDEARLLLYAGAKRLELEAEQALLAALEDLVKDKKIELIQHVKSFVHENVQACAKAFAPQANKAHLLDFIAKIEAPRREGKP